jgi:hypothetical protein
MIANVTNVSKESTTNPQFKSAMKIFLTINKKILRSQIMYEDVIYVRGVFSDWYI